eukprot:gene23056-29248_t
MSGELICTGEGHRSDIWALAVTAQSSTPSTDSVDHSCPNSHYTHSNHTHYYNTQLPLIVSGSFDRAVRVWDINPMLLDICWERRRDFCVFLSGLGICSKQGLIGQTSSSDNTSSSSSSSVKTRQEQDTSQIIVCDCRQRILRGGDSTTSNAAKIIHLRTDVEIDSYCSSVSVMLAHVLSGVFQQQAMCVHIASFL